jgi:hypothetical protein
MDPTLLREHLTKLHEDLRAAPRVDPESNRLLGELLEDIKQLLARSAAPDARTPEAADTAATPASLSDRLEKIALLFAVDHPTLAANSRRLVDVLGKMGL